MAVKTKATVQDYKELPEGSPYQLIEGELVMSPAPKPVHQIVLGNLFEVFRKFLKGKGIIIFSPIDVYFDEENAFQPDLIFISKERKDILKEDGVYGAPDLVVEILSPSTAYYDLRKKKEVYERKGVREYWIVDPEMREIEIYVNEDGKFKLVEEAKEKGKIRSKIIDNLEVNLEDIFPS